jgi:hypothetical protein
MPERAACDDRAESRSHGLCRRRSAPEAVLSTARAAVQRPATGRGYRRMQLGRDCTEADDCIGARSGRSLEIGDEHGAHAFRSAALLCSLAKRGTPGRGRPHLWSRPGAPVWARVPYRSDRPSALRRSALLRTGRAALTASGSSRSRGLRGGQSSGLVAVLAVGVYETVFSLVGRGVRGHDRDRVAGGGEPSFPVLGAWWLLIDAE